MPPGVIWANRDADGRSSLFTHAPGQAPGASRVPRSHFQTISGILPNMNLLDNDAFAGWLADQGDLLWTENDMLDHRALPVKVAD
ncbi:hypothetical protein GCM10009628_19310 [Paeniglutamicibacter kerguelensis]